VRTWEEDGRFRAFVDGERAAGRLAAEEIAAIADVPGQLWRAAWNEAWEAKMERAKEILRDSGCSGDRRSWADWVRPAPSRSSCR
jgi:hypothetical protein